MKFKLTAKLLIIFSITLIVPCLTIGYSSIHSAKDKMEHQITSSNRQNVSVINQLINEFLENRLKEIDIYSQFFSAENTSKNTAESLRLLDSFDQQHPSFDFIYYGTIDGKFYSAPRKDLGADYDPRERPWYKTAMSKPGQLTISSPYQSKTLGEWVVGIGKAFPDKSGVLSAEVKIADLNNVIKKVKIGNHGYAVLLDNTGNVIVYPRETMGTSVVNPYTAAMKNAQADKLQVYTGEHGKQKLIYTKNALSGWVIGGMQMKSDITNATNPILYTTTIASLLALLVAALVAIGFARHLLSNVKRLASAANRISSGDLTQPIQLKTRDELGMLGESFNQMNESLRTMVMNIGDTSGHLASSSQQLTASAEETTKAAEQITESIQEVATSSENQVVDVQVISKSAADIAESMQFISRHTEAATRTAVGATGHSELGVEAVSDVISRMDSISGQVENVHHIVNRLQAHSVEIAEIIGILSAIASQTNILALNASIEAARAGEHGRGFTIVASEVKKLAEQSGKFSAQVAELIHKIQDETDQAALAMNTTVTVVTDGLASVQTAGELFGQIRQSVNTMRKEIEQIADSSQEVFNKTSNTANAIHSIVESASETAGGSQNVSAAAEEQLAAMEQISASAAAMSRMAEDLQLVVDKFKI